MSTANLFSGFVVLSGCVFEFIDCILDTGIFIILDIVTELWGDFGEPGGELVFSGCSSISVSGRDD